MNDRACIRGARRTAGRCRSCWRNAGSRTTCTRIDIGKGDQFAPEYLAINPNGKIPSIVDPDGPDGKPIAMMESGAILIYLAAKTGRFLPASARDKYAALQWLMFQMGRVGPMYGQVAPLPARGEGRGAVRDRALRQGEGPALRRARPRGSARRGSSPATSTRSPTSRPIRGSRGTSGTRPTSQRTRT